MQLVVFRVGGEQYALPIGEVREIIRHVAPRRVPSSVASLDGVIDLRGRILPVHDLSAILGCEPAPTSEGKVVVVDTRYGAIGLGVEEVDAVLSVADEDIEPRGRLVGDRVRNLARHGDAILVILEANRLLSAADGESAFAAA